MNTEQLRHQAGLLTVQEASRVLKVSPVALLACVSLQRVPFSRVGQELLISSEFLAGVGMNPQWMDLPPHNRDWFDAFGPSRSDMMITAKRAGIRSLSADYLHRGAVQLAQDEAKAIVAKESRLSSMSLLERLYDRQPAALTKLANKARDLALSAVLHNADGTKFTLGSLLSIEAKNRILHDAFGFGMPKQTTSYVRPRANEGAATLCRR